jgi:ribosomal protein L40E
MTCHQCGTQNPERAHFCLKCGARLVLACPQCQTELPSHAEFCFACGARLTCAGRKTPSAHGSAG